MATRHLFLALPALVPPGVAFALGVWTATPKGTEESAGETFLAAVPSRAANQAGLPRKDGNPATAPCDDPILRKLDALESRLEEEQREAAFRQARLEDALYAALEQCDIGLEVVELDCREAPCVVITHGGDTNWWNSLALCPAWYDLYGGMGAYHSNAVPCGDGGEEAYQAVTEPLAFYGIEDDTELDDPDLAMRALQRQGYVVTARVQELAAEWTCGEERADRQ